MKLFIASDIHGSGLYCKKMIHAFNVEKADKLILLGDILYHGPRNALPNGHDPKLVIELLNSIKEKIICVKGNCDAEVDQMVLEFPILDGEFSFNVDGLDLIASHGHHVNAENPPKRDNDYVLLNGHTHIPDYKKYDNFCLVNPGSISLPKGGSEHSYIVYHNKTFVWKNLKGEIFKEVSLLD